MQNRRAYHDFTIIDSYECGIVLNGDEVKAIRNGTAQFNDSFIQVKNNELYIYNMFVAAYTHRDITAKGHPLRVRKLLAHKEEIRDMKRAVMQKRSTLVPLDIHLSQRKLIKLKIAIAKGKKNIDKRASIKARDIDRDTRREMKER